MASVQNPDASMNPKHERNVLEENVYLNLLRAYHSLQKDLRTFFEEHELTHRQYNVLRILYVRGKNGLSCQTIRERLVTNVSDISRLIDRMVDKNLVRRERSEKDRRVVLIHLTDGGKTLCQTVDDQLVKKHKNQFDHLPQSEIEQLNELLLKVIDRPDTNDERGD